MTSVVAAEPRDLAALFDSRAHSAPDDLAYRIHRDDGSIERIHWGALHSTARSWSSVMLAAGLERGGRVLVALDHGSELIACLWAGIAAGASVGCFQYLQRKPQADAYASQIATLARRTRIDLVVTFDWFVDVLRPQIEATGARALGIREIVERASDLAPSGGSSALDAGTEEEAIVFFSGGTTGASKPIPQTHGAVMAQLRMIADRLRIEAGERHGYWIPLSHDLGMNLGFLMPAFAGTSSALVSPFAWARAPGRFMKLLSDDRIALTAMPNFGLEHTARHTRANDETLDLSGLRHLVCAAEPVREESLRRFHLRFDGCGLRESAIVVGYGMAEATCGLTTTMPGLPRVDRVRRIDMHSGARVVPARVRDEQVVAIVSCGVPMAGAEIRIVDVDGAPLPPRVVGEIVARARSMMNGYLGVSDASAFLADGFYRTGDLGYLADGELFVCGRLKDVIVSAGRNVNPQDVEEIAGSIDGIRHRGVVAFGVRHPRLATEGVVVVAELERGVTEEQLRDLDRDLRARVEQALGLSLVDLMLVSRRGWVVRGASGKTARALNRQKYLDLVASQDGAIDVSA